MTVSPNNPASNRYAAIISKIFLDKRRQGDESVPFRREDIRIAADALGMDPPKNLGDVVYAFRYRTALPEDIQSTASEGKMWIIRSAGTGIYQFDLVPVFDMRPNPNLAATKM